MSQWGKAKTINDSKFLPHVRTKGFADISMDSLIDSIELINVGKNTYVARTILRGLRKKHIGKSYVLWEL